MTSQESAVESSGVTGDMLDVAEGLLRELSVGRMSKKYSNRDVLYEILRAALFVSHEPSGLTKSEVDWARFFKDCKVIVKDPAVGRQLMQEGLETVEAFTALIESVAQNKAIIISLEEYPGVSLFRVEE